MLLILIRTAILYIFLNVIMRFMGKRQLGELDVCEMVSTLLLSELVAVSISDPSQPLLASIIPALFILASELFISSYKNRSKKLKAVLEGKPLYIIYKGRILQDALRESRISLNEFLCALRTNGIFSIAQVDYAILEANGSVTTLLKCEDSTPTLSDLSAPHKNMKNGHSPMSHALVIDGEIMQKNLSLLGLNDVWLQKQLTAEHIRLSEVFLFSYSENGERYIVKKENE